MSEISTTFPFMQELSVPAEGISPAERNVVYQQMGHTAAYLEAEFGEHAMRGQARNGRDESTLFFYGEQEGALVVVDTTSVPSHQTSRQLEDVTMSFEEVGPNGTRATHMYAQLEGRGPVRRIDKVSPQPGQVYPKGQPVYGAGAVRRQEAVGLHDFMIHQTDHGLYVPVPMVDAMRLRFGIR